MSRGRRYSGGEPKLNIKKVLAVLIVLAVIIMVIFGIIKLTQGSARTQERTVANGYFSVYTNGKWGVINSRGETVIEPQYDEAIIVPDQTKAVFVCTYDVDYTNNTYKSRVINDKNEEIITGYDTIQVLENYDSSNNLWYENDVLLVSQQGKYGLVDFTGRVLLTCEYDSIETLKGVTNSLVTEKEGKLGLVDNIGSVILENIYKEIEPISDQYENGYIVTNEDNQKGVIKNDKTVLVQVQYDDIKPMNGDGRYVVQEDDEWKIIDSEGNEYLAGAFDDVVSINGNNVIVEIDNQYGIMTLSGETRIQAKYQNMSYAFSDNYIFRENNKYGVINLAGEEVLEPTYDSLIYRSDDGFLEGSKSDTVDTDFIGNDFTVKVSGILSEINTPDGYMKIRTNGEYKYYNFRFEEKTNRELLTGNTLFLDQKDGKYGYVNKDGVVVVDYIYDDAKEQNAFGYASVKKDGLWGCINSQGEEVVTPTYTLENNSLIEFINQWYRGEDLNLNYYTNE